MVFHIACKCISQTHCAESIYVQQSKAHHSVSNRLIVTWWGGPESVHSEVTTASVNKGDLSVTSAAHSCARMTTHDPMNRCMCDSPSCVRESPRCVREVRTQRSSQRPLSRGFIQSDSLDIFFWVERRWLPCCRRDAPSLPSPQAHTLCISSSSSSSQEMILLLQTPGTFGFSFTKLRVNIHW